MPKVIEAVYESGVLRPLQPLDLAENERVTIRLTTATDDGLAHEYLKSVREELEADPRPVPSLEEVRRILSKIPGELSADITAERGDR